MNAVRPGLADPLIGMLGARWALGALPTGAAWLAGGESAAFGLSDGTVALAPARWEGAARVQARAAGGVELVPASAPPPPVMRIGVHEGPCLAVAADAVGGLLSGGQDGRLVRITAQGQTATCATYPGLRVGHVAVSSAGVPAWAAGASVRLGDTVLDMPGPVTALAFDPDGLLLAVAHHLGLTLLSVAAGTTSLLRHAGTHQALAWSADARLLASGMAEGMAHLWHRPDGGETALQGHAAAPLSLAFSQSGGFLASSGGQRVLCWHLDVPGTPRRADCGIGSMQLVTCVACHPRRALIAAGYANGAVLLCQPGSSDILFVREAGGGAVAVLAWSPDGGTLAIGVEAGEIGIVAFPDSLFRTAQDNGSRS